MKPKKVRQRIKYLYKYRFDNIQIIQTCVYDLDTNKIYVRIIKENRTPYTISRINKKQEIPCKPTSRCACTILKDHAKNMKSDPERLSTKFMREIIGIECD